MKKLKLFLLIIFISGFIYGQNENKENPPPKTTQTYLYNIYDKIKEAIRVITIDGVTSQDTVVVITGDSVTVKNTILFTNPYKPYTPLDTVVHITNTATPLSTLLGKNWNLRGGLLELWNYHSGRVIAHGGTNVGLDSTKTGGVLYFGDPYRDEYGFYPQADSCYVVTDSATAYLRVRLIGR